MNIITYTTKYYEQKTPLRMPAKQTQNKPNQTQFLYRFWGKYSWLFGDFSVKYAVEVLGAVWGISKRRIQ